MYDKKASLFYILNILKEYSDELHPLTQKDIIEKLKQIYLVDIERKTISSTIDLLISLDFDIIKAKDGCYLNEREFDETEIRFLIDAIYSSKLITSSQANELATRLYSSLSKYQKKDFNYIYKSKEISRTNNKAFFYNIDIITEAIKSKKKITFNYIYYDINGNIIMRKNGYKYTSSPYYLINNFGKYYLIASNNNYNNHIIYRLDYLANLKITNEDIRPIEEIASLGKDFNINKYINEHIYLFGGEVISSKILIKPKKEEKGITYIYDWFGSNAKIINENNNTYALIKSDEMALFYWLLQYIEFFIVIEPISLRNKIISTIKNTLDEYNNINI